MANGMGNPGAAGFGGSSPGTGANSEQIGSGATASGTDATAYGDLSQATATDTTAVGYFARATSTSDTIVGASATGSGTSVVIGKGATGASSAQVVIGNTAITAGTCANSVVIGNGAGLDTAGSGSSVVIGDSAQNSAGVASTGIVCIGKSTRAKQNSIAIGNAAIAAHTNALAIGASATTTGNNDAQLGTSGQPYNINTYGTFTHNAQALTAGTMTQTAVSQVRKVLHQYSWTNAMVTALAASADDITVCTLPAKTVVTNAYIVITSAAGTVTTLTVAVGRTGATYIDYIVASDAKAAANTVYGDAVGERGSNLTGYDLPSYTGTTVVKAHFVSTGGTLSTVTTSTGTIYLETMILP